MVSKVQPRPTGGALLQVRIELRGTKPKVWRRVLVPQTITLAKLHLVIQAAFGWGHSHLHEFIAGDGERYGAADPMYDPPGSINSENVRLTTVLRTSTLSYVYDFGDYWDHRITIEQTHAADPLITLPLCIGGAGATPPEDCGGAPGYADFVRAMADPNDPEHAHLADWIGVPSWDPKAFDSTEANDRLAAIQLRGAMIRLTKNIERLIDEGGEITLGRLPPFDCVATATDAAACLAMLVRSDGETLTQLIQRLDKAIHLAWTDKFTDEVNGGPSDRL